MAVGFRASPTGGATTGTGFTATEPAGTANDDVLLVGILVEAGFSSFSGPAGFTVEYGPIDCTAFTAWIYSKRRSGASSLAVSWSSSKYYEWCIGGFTGCVTSGAYMETKAQLSAAQRTTVDPPAVTTTTTDTMIVCPVFHWSGYFSNAGPTGYTQYGEGVFIDNKSAYRAEAAAGSKDPSAYASPGSNDWSWAATFALASTAGSSTVTGTLASIAQGQDFAATGNVPRSGTLISIPSGQVFAGAGSTALLGSLSSIVAAQQTSISGIVPVRGTAASATAPQAFEAEGELPITGALSSGAAAQVFAASGSGVSSGTCTSVAASQTTLISGNVIVQGTLQSMAAPQQTQMLGPLSTGGSGNYMIRNAVSRRSGRRR